MLMVSLFKDIVCLICGEMKRKTCIKLSVRYFVPLMGGLVFLREVILQSRICSVPLFFRRLIFSLAMESLPKGCAPNIRLRNCRLPKFGACSRPCTQIFVVFPHHLRFLYVVYSVFSL